MGNIVSVGTNRPDVKVWLDEVGKEERHIYMAIAGGFKNNKLSKAEAERVSFQEMLALRHLGFEMPKGFKPEVAEQEIDGEIYMVVKYVFQWTELKRVVMGYSGGGKAPVGEKSAV